MTSQAWAALVAPLGVPSDAGQVLAADTRWRLRSDAAPLTYGGDIVGRVVAVWQTDTDLFAAGTTDLDGLADAISRGVLYPELDLGQVQSRLLGEPPAAIEFAGGSVDALTLSVGSCWRGRVWIRLLSTLPAAGE